MGHHGYPEIYTPKDQEALKHQFEQFKEKFSQLPPDIGATGSFPDGSIHESDKGQLMFGILVQDGRVIFHFGEKPISWIGFNKQEIIGLRDYLNEKIRQLP